MRRWTSGLAAVLMLAAGTPRAQTVPIDVVLSRAAHYVGVFIEQFSNVVAEERYSQDADPTSSLNFGGSRAQHRELKSDFLLVKTSGGLVDWTPFRDVFEVDRRPVRDRDERLSRLFLG